MSLELEVLPVTPFQQNCSILMDKENARAILIDAGGDGDRIQAKLESLGVKAEAIWLTHGHLDHAGESRKLADQFGIDLIGPHRDDQFWLDRLEMQSQTFGFEPTASFKPDRYLNDGDQLQFAGLGFQVLHCPGHTPGHVVFYQPDHNICIVGDVLFAGSIGRTDFPMSRHEDLLESIRSKLFCLPDDCVVYPGHGPTTTIGVEKRTNPYVGTSI